MSLKIRIKVVNAKQTPFAFLSRSNSVRKIYLVREKLRVPKAIVYRHPVHTIHTEKTRILLFIASFLTTFQHDEQALQSPLSSVAFPVHVHETSIKRRPHNLGMRLRGLSAPREPYEAISRNKLLTQLGTLVTSWTAFGDTRMLMTRKRDDKNVFKSPWNRRRHRGYFSNKHNSRTRCKKLFRCTVLNLATNTFLKSHLNIIIQRDVMYNRSVRRLQ